MNTRAPTIISSLRLQRANGRAAKAISKEIGLRRSFVERELFYMLRFSSFVCSLHEFWSKNKPNNYEHATAMIDFGLLDNLIAHNPDFLDKVISRIFLWRGVGLIKKIDPDIVVSNLEDRISFRRR